MARWATLLENRRREKPVMLIDAGDFCAVGKVRDQEIKNKYFFEALEMLRYDVLAVAENEILFGRRNLEGTAKVRKLQLVSANILDRKSHEPIFDRYIIKRAGGGRFLFFRSGGVKVGVFSVANPELVYGADRLVKDHYEIIDPRIAALDVVTDLREKGCDIIVALSHQEWDLSVEFAREIPGVDIVVASHSSMTMSMSAEIDGTLVVAPGMGTTSFTEIEVTWRAGDTRMIMIDRGKELLEMKDHPEFVEIEERYNKETGKSGDIREIK
jgi:2',3'-cyclic-nucleotide 2'-phosphodiesterase (5'-nucleotidase family)